MYFVARLCKIKILKCVGCEFVTGITDMVYLVGLLKYVIYQFLGNCVRRNRVKNAKYVTEKLNLIVCPRFCDFNDENIYNLFKTSKPVKFSWPDGRTDKILIF